eukprot:1555965-Alexandrium_andersonii.AAC.1
MLTGNIWDPVRILGKDRPTKVVRLDSKIPRAKTADVYADYLEKEHWAMRRSDEAAEDTQPPVNS